jgi:flagellar biosynthesis protein FliR
MCCFKSRAVPQWTILILSIATVITSGLMIAYAVVFIYSELVENILDEGFLQEEYSDFYDSYGENA